MLLNKFKLCFFVLLITGNSAIFAKSTTDKDIDTQIDMLYARNPVLKEHEVCSKTNEHQVTLKGCVQSHAEKELAQDLASLVEYVDKIDNQIKVNPKLPAAKNKASVPDKMSDALISRLVHAKIILNQSIHASNVQVKTLNGITILTGNVSSVEEKKLAYTIALETKGVVDVKNKLKVRAGA
ncbi:Osmotically-inducible protein Y precursor [Legionella beliardensis]|uniref:Osmotically-inducible protein Y n=1 Tax=Legionella beliardensis TaxID=91822 RepID=A0A378I008_9GAMM|nr:BON domain-containing protein [Legionella beliardensis]STX28527.1 Osmotically-inducible protein Y precursor [Legionella beliardensis]